MPKIVSIGCLSASVLFVSANALADEAPSGTASPSTAPTEASVAGHATPDIVGPHYRSPGLAVALSLTPLPVDFGNFYAENIAWGAAYTTAEVALMTPMMWLVGGHMHDEDDDWNDEERGWAIGLVAGYVLVKIASGVHAGFAADDYNREHQTAGFVALPSVAAVPGGGTVGARAVF